MTRLFVFVRRSFSKSTPLGLIENIADLRNPAQWHPAARSIQRDVHLHVGPTNSGKTHQALTRLRAASTGIYAGPLRLLAHEIYDRMNLEYRKPCKLLTGEERRDPPSELCLSRATSPKPGLEDDFLSPDAEESFVSDMCGHIASTVEMTPLNTRFDVAVLDEIQMIADPTRGWAWTQAFLGVQSPEVHLCGEPTAIPLIKSLCETTGDKFHLHEYKRLSPLAMGECLQSNWKNIQPGDCVIAFSRSRIFQLKMEIEAATSLRCAIVYGSLPPETRSEQAKLFNDPKSGYDVLVASDAVGMGLNLNIRRVIFSAVDKFDGNQVRKLNISEVKQIGGRAGRYGTHYNKKTASEKEDFKKADSEKEFNNKTEKEDFKKADSEKKEFNNKTSENEESNSGYVTTLHRRDLSHVRKIFKLGPNDVPNLSAAGLQPTDQIIADLSSQMPDATFAELLDHFEKVARVGGDYFLCNLQTAKELAELIEPFQLPLSDRYALINSPASLRSDLERIVFAELAEARSIYYTLTESLSNNLQQNIQPRNSVHPWSAAPSKLVHRSEAISEKGFFMTDLSCVRHLLKHPISVDFKTILVDGTEHARKQLYHVWLPPHDQFSLSKFEALHRAVTLYAWLHYRFPSTFPDIDLAKVMKQSVEDVIEKALESFRARRYKRKFEPSKHHSKTPYEKKQSKK